MSKAKRRGGEDPDPEILRLAGIAAGLLVEVFSTPEEPITKVDLLGRPRPSGKLKNVRDLMVGALHFHFCFNAKTGEVARRSPETTGKNWSPISQQRIAAALGRDRGVISDAAHGVDDAINGDVGVCVALTEVTESIANLMAQADAWREALRQDALEQAIKQRAAEHAQERAVLDRVEHDIAEDLPAIPTPGQIMCHACRGKRTVRVHRLGGDPAYRAAWEAANAAAPAADGFQTLTCRFCDGDGVRPAKPAAALGSAILAGARE